MDIRDGKISLSLKALKENPWTDAGNQFKEGETVKGKVYGFHPYGAIIALAGGLQGQVHVSEFGSVEEMKKQLPIGKEHVFVVESVKPEEERILLKLKKE
jgi:ribosomal protein S1